MFAKIKCGVKVKGHFSNFFQNDVGLIMLMQGELLSLLYSLYINNIENKLKRQGCQSYE